MNPAGATVTLAPIEAEVRFRPERPIDRKDVDALIEAAFGPGRFAKTAERLREGNGMRRDLSYCAWIGPEMAAAVRQWPIRIDSTPAVFLGPIATRPERRGQGFGRALIRHVCQLAWEAGDEIVLLVGDRAYFQPLGFVPVEPGRVTLPGPVDPLRLLWMSATPAALDGVAGPVAAAPGEAG